MLLDTVNVQSNVKCFCEIHSRSWEIEIIIWNIDQSFSQRWIEIEIVSVCFPVCNRIVSFCCITVHRHWSRIFFFKGNRGEKFWKKIKYIYSMYTLKNVYTQKLNNHSTLSLFSRGRRKMDDFPIYRKSLF